MIRAISPRSGHQYLLRGRSKRDTLNVSPFSLTHFVSVKNDDDDDNDNDDLKSNHERQRYSVDWSPSTRRGTVNSMTAVRVWANNNNDNSFRASFSSCQSFSWRSNNKICTRAASTLADHTNVPSSDDRTSTAKKSSSAFVSLDDDTKVDMEQRDTTTVSSKNKTIKKTNTEKFQHAAHRGKKAVTKGAHSVRDLMSKYGYSFLGTYLTLYAVTLTSIFVGVDSGMIDPITITNFHPWSTTPTTTDEIVEAKSTVDWMVDYMEHIEWLKPYAGQVQKNPHVANFGLAWVATKFTEPIRLGIAFVIVPRVARFFGQVPKEDNNNDEEDDDDNDDDDDGNKNENHYNQEENKVKKQHNNKGH